MLPEQPKPESAIEKYEGQNELPAVGALIGGNATIEPILGRSGKKEGYNVTFIKDDGSVTKFQLSAKNGDELIEARLAEMSRRFANIDEEAQQALVPSLVAAEYRRRLIELGTSEDRIPNSTSEMIEMAKEELIAFQSLGVEEIAVMAQGVTDESYNIYLEVLKGDSGRYNRLPKKFQKSIDDLIPLMQAKAMEHSGITEKTLATSRLAFQINLLSKEETYQAFLAAFPALAEAGADTIAKFFGNLIGTTGGAVVGSFEKAKEVAKRKKNS